MTAAKYRVLTQCRACGGSDLAPYLDFGPMPLANALLTSAELPHEERFPLVVLFCRTCALSQLSIVVDPEALFRHYVYRSSISGAFRRHCHELAVELQGRVLRPDDLVVDIASNDGCLLGEFKALGSRVLGVDPAMNLARAATERGIPTLADYWGERAAREAVERSGKARVITGTNVFAHVDDMHGFVEAAKVLLADGGYLVLESPHLQSLLATNEFDTIYHEHLSYLLAGPVDRLVRQHGMSIERVKKTDIHGGSIRFYITRTGEGAAPDGSLAAVLEEEKTAGLYEFDAYAGFAAKVDAVRRELVALLGGLAKQGKRIAGFGASAKGNVLLNYCRVGPDLVECIFDDTVDKHHKLYPGVHIPIVPASELAARRPDYLLLLAWNFAREIMDKTTAFQHAGGRYVVPIPAPRVV